MIIYFIYRFLNLQESHDHILSLFAGEFYKKLLNVYCYQANIGKCECRKIHTFNIFNCKCSCTTDLYLQVSNYRVLHFHNIGYWSRLNYPVLLLNLSMDNGARRAGLNGRKNGSRDAFMSSIPVLSAVTILTTSLTPTTGITVITATTIIIDRPVPPRSSLS